MSNERMPHIWQDGYIKINDKCTITINEATIVANKNQFNSLTVYALSSFSKTKQKKKKNPLHSIVFQREPFLLT
jgi:hypothetical protein